MKYIKFPVFAILLMLLFSSCETTELELLDDPNATTPATANVNLLLNSSQSSFNSLIGRLDRTALSYTRMRYQFGAYVSGPTAFDAAWNNYYSSFLIDNRTVTNRALADGLTIHAGISQVLEAFATITMVDFFGDIPYSEAAQGTDFEAPLFDDDATIYNQIYTLLDDAIINLSNPDGVPIANDLFYDGDVSNWIRLANTIKLKMYVQTKNVNPTLSKDMINQLILEDNMITSSSQDFAFTYGTNVSVPDTRHPLFSTYYGAGGSGTYMSNSYMNELKSKNDPRFRYYFFRQTLNDPTGSNLVCSPNPPQEFCYIGDGYWGRDHATTTGIPADGTLRTAYGLYPIGGAFDKDEAHDAIATDGAQGAGIEPIMLSSFVNFLLAEATLTIDGVNGDPITFFENGVTQSIAKVRSFGTLPGVSLGTFAPSNTDVSAFISNMVNEYNNAGSTEDKLEVVMRQFWVAASGNGKEIYDAHRRTGHPVLQSPVELPAIYPRLNLYPSVEINSNENAPQQRQITEQVFWDTNPAGFID